MSLSVRLVDTAINEGSDPRESMVVSTDGVDSNELLVALVDSDAGDGDGPPEPDGWTIVATDESAAGNITWVVVKDTLGPGDATYAFSTASGADGAVILLAVAATAGSPAFDAAAATGVQPAASANMVAPSVTAGAGPAQIMLCHWMLYSGQSAASITVPGGMTSLVSNLRSNGWGHRSVAWEAVAEGATGTRTATASSSSPGHVSSSVAFHQEGGDLDPIDAVGATLAPPQVAAGSAVALVAGSGATTAAAQAAAASGSVPINAAGATTAAAQVAAGTGGDLTERVDVTVAVAPVRSRAQVTTGATRQGWAVGPTRRERGPQ